MEIGNYLFADHKTLLAITISETVTEIGDGMFYRCTNLKTVTILDIVTKLVDGTIFYGCMVVRPRSPS